MEKHRVLCKYTKKSNFQGQLRVIGSNGITLIHCEANPRGVSHFPKLKPMCYGPIPESTNTEVVSSLEFGDMTEYK